MRGPINVTKVAKIWKKSFIKQLLLFLPMFQRSHAEKKKKKHAPLPYPRFLIEQFTEFIKNYYHFKKAYPVDLSAYFPVSKHSHFTFFIDLRTKRGEETWINHIRIVAVTEEKNNPLEVLHGINHQWICRIVSIHYSR